MNKSRRDFLKKLPLAMSVPFTIGGIPLRVLGGDSALAKMAAASTNDRVLIILQLSGGNDGLNTVIPISNYEEYYSRRANIAIPAKNKTRGLIPVDDTLPPDAQVGFHPDMQAVKALYDIGRVKVVQGVSYENNNGSHFRGRDIWFMGGGAQDYFQSGWVGRYLQGEYAPKKYPEEFPNPQMLDPLAIEMGNDVSLIFHQAGNIPTSISITNPEQFNQLVGELDGFNEERLGQIDPRGIPPEYIAGSPYYKELQWILSLEDKSKDYAARMFQVWRDGQKGTTTYPETYPLYAPKGSKRNGLTPQLQMVARMLAGGCKTKIFLVKIGGFDSHADQVQRDSPSMGGHAALLYHIATAMKAFQDDLRARGLEDRVLTVTTSEFGRNITSNGSYGTDHGDAGPLFVFGKGVQPGVLGKVPEMGTNRNVDMQYDYRKIYSNIMKDWMGVDEARLNVIFPGLMDAAGTTDGVKFEQLPIAQQTITGIDDFISSRFSYEGCYPNPATAKTTVHFKINASNQVTVNLIDSKGNHAKTLVSGIYAPGEHRIEVDLTDLPTGTYISQFKSGFYQEAKKLIIAK